MDPADGSLSTELLRARWKRIILDEGNIANNMKSDAMILAEALSIERRWIVSGSECAVATPLTTSTDDEPEAGHGDVHARALRRYAARRLGGEVTEQLSRARLARPRPLVQGGP